MTSPKLLAALAYIVVGLTGRALIDKLLALHGGAQEGAVVVAAWAQITTLSDAVSAVCLTGIGIALTVRTAVCTERERLAWLKAGLIVGTALALLIALASLPLLIWLAPSLLPEGSGIASLALAVGVMMVPPGILIAWQIGLGRLGAATRLALLQAAMPIAAYLYRPSGEPLVDLLAGQAAFGLLIAGALMVLLRRQPACRQEHLHALLRFAPAGFAIGLLGPTATAWARVEMAHSLSWQAVGQVQAIWRSSEWITATTAGVLNAVFLPRLAATPGRRQFIAELRHATRRVLLPTALLLAALWGVLPELMVALYRVEMQVPTQHAALFLLGDWLRILSWIPLFGLFARQATWAVSLGEIFSLPLFACLLYLASPVSGLGGVGLCWTLAYGSYALFNGLALGANLVRTASDTPGREPRVRP